jgi:PHD/YefM family antitoxin component YafN of YafNO toxin-antitoxin module
VIKRAKKPTTKLVSALTARTQFGQIMKRATQHNERFLVDRRGEPSVIIMSVQDYIDTIAPAPDWLDHIGEASKRRGTDKLTLGQINAEIRTARREQQEGPKSRHSRTRR